MSKTISYAKRSSQFLQRRMRILSFCILYLLTHCSGPPPPSPLPPSESDLNVLGQAKLCQTKNTAQTSLLKYGYHETPWGGGTELFQEVSSPDKQGQWLIFNEDQTLVGVITAFPNGLSLDPYPTLRKTLSQLAPAREFFFNSSRLLKGKKPDSVTLYRTGEATTTHQYFIRHTVDQEKQLVMAVFVLDPYEALLDGSHKKFLAYLDKPTSQQQNHSTTEKHPWSPQEFLGLQQFARGEISLFASCNTKDLSIAIKAYQKAVEYGLPDPKQLAEAHHRQGLAHLSLGDHIKAKEAIQNALELQPHSARMLNSYGSALAKGGELSQAIKAYEQALALQPNYAQARFNLGESFESLNPKRAIQEYETFLILVENNPEEFAKAKLAEARIQALQSGKKR